MKNQIYILSLFVGLSLIACQKKNFSPTALSNNNLNQGNPTDGSCVSTDPVLDSPMSVASGTVFTLSYNRSNVVWTLTLLNGTTITLDGSPVTTSLTPVGRVSGSVSGIDNCGRNSYQTFVFEVSGEGPVPTTTTTSTTLPSPTTTLPSVTTTTTLPPSPTTTLPSTTTTLPTPTTTLPPTTTTTLPSQPPATTQDFTVDSSGSADILFVVNDAPSTWYTLRESVPVRFSHFVAKLKDKVDYRISVTSAQAFGVTDYQSGRLTKILYQPAPDMGIALVPNQFAITPAMEPHSGRYFLATIMRPESICIGAQMPCINPSAAYQEAIHSTILALNNTDSVAKLIRPNAALNVVIISENDEGVGNLTDRHGNIKANTPSYNRPQTLIDLVHSKWPGKAFRAHAVMQRPEDPICMDPDIYNAAPGYIYDDLVKKTGGVTADICDTYEQDSIKKIANSMATASPTFQLKCQPTAIQATYSPQPSVPTRAVVNGTNVSFDPALPAGTKVHLQYQCQ